MPTSLEKTNTPEEHADSNSEEEIQLPETDENSETDEEKNEENEDNEDNKEKNEENEDNEDKNDTNEDSEDNEENEDKNDTNEDSDTNENSETDEDKNKKTKSKKETTKSDDNENDNNEEVIDLNDSISFDSNIDIFESNDDIVIKEKISFDTIDNNIENEVYLNDLQNQLLSDYPLYKQSAKYIQDIVFDEATKIIELKNRGVKVLKNKYNNNAIIENYANNKFNQYFMIPIVSDIKITYKKSEEASLSNSSSDIQPANMNNDITIEDFKSQIKKLNKLEEDLKWDKLQKIHQTTKSNYNIYVSELYKLIASFRIEDKPGYKTYINEDSKLLRHHNIDGLNWELRRGLSGYYYSLYNPAEETNDNIEEINVHLGEEINIVGFFKLPIISENIYDVLNSNDSSHRFGKIGDITKIEVGEKTIITCTNHGLIKDEYIYIEDSNSVPPINNTYQISEIIDNNKLTISTGIKGTDGDKGVLYSSLKLSYRITNIVKVGHTFKLQHEKKIINESKNRLVGDVYLLGNTITENEYVQVLKHIIPSYFDIINEMNINKLDIKYIDDINKHIKKYGFQFNDLNIKEVDIFKKVLLNAIGKSNKQSIIKGISSKT